MHTRNFYKKKKADFCNIKKFAAFIRAMDMRRQCSKNFTARRYNLSNSKCWILFLKVVSCSRYVVSLLLCYIRFFDVMVDFVIQAMHMQIRNIIFLLLYQFLYQFWCAVCINLFFVCFRILKIFAECSVKRMKIYLLDYKLLPFTFCKR